MSMTATHSAYDRSTSTDLPYQFRDCTSKEQRMQWLRTERAQKILLVRPHIRGLYESGQISDMLDRPRFIDRLKDRLYLSGAEGRNAGLIPGLTDVFNRIGAFTTSSSRSGNWKQLKDSFYAQFDSYPSFLSPAEFPVAQKYNILIDGFTIFPGTVPPELLDAAEAVIDATLAEHGPDSVDAAQVNGFRNDKELLALYYCSPVCNLVELLLHNTTVNPENVSNGKVRVRMAQVAYRPPLNQQQVQSNRNIQRRIVGTRWHIDGILQQKKFAAFNLLAGVALSDHMADFAGNLFVHAGSHHRLTGFMTAVADALGAFSSAAVADEEKEERVTELDAQKPDLGQPLQVQLRRGDIVLVLHRIAHGISPNFSEKTRKMVYFRVSHKQHDELQLAALSDMWLEYEGMREVL